MVPHMRSSTALYVLAAALILSPIGALAPAIAQQVTGTPGSPEATTTVPGNQLPLPPQSSEEPAPQGR